MLKPSPDGADSAGKGTPIIRDCVLHRVSPEFRATDSDRGPGPRASATGGEGRLSSSARPRSHVAFKALPFGVAYRGFRAGRSCFLPARSVYPQTPHIIRGSWEPESFFDSPLPRPPPRLPRGGPQEPDFAGSRPRPPGAGTMVVSSPEMPPTALTAPTATGNISKAILLGVILKSQSLSGCWEHPRDPSVACHRHLHSVTHYYIVNLAVADLPLPRCAAFSAIFEILGCTGPLGRSSQRSGRQTSCAARLSIMGLCIISIDRYIGVSYPLRYPTIVTQKRPHGPALRLGALFGHLPSGPSAMLEAAGPERTRPSARSSRSWAMCSSRPWGTFKVPPTIILVMYCRPTWWPRGEPGP